ncbi:MAG: Holliday junction branch migration DNA helicase RuvB, partial [Chloroflexota bacterium]
SACTSSKVHTDAADSPAAGGDDSFATVPGDTSEPVGDDTGPDDVPGDPDGCSDLYDPEVLQDFAVDIIIGKGPGARSLRLSLPRFTLVGATTRYALLSPPLRDRFGAVYRLDFYSPEAVRLILERSARILGIAAEDDGLWEIARRSRGTPRIANRLLRRVRDFAQVLGDGVISRKSAVEALERLDVDEKGLDLTDHRVLRTIIEKYNGGPVGLETIAASISEEADTIMDVYEPYLMQMGFLGRTPRGRVATRLAYEHLGLPFKEQEGAQQAGLF